MFVDPEDGSNKILRLMFAGSISCFYLSLMAIARPYKETSNLRFVFLSNFLLTLSFVLSIITLLCGEEGEICDRFVGFTSSYEASISIIVTGMMMLIVTIVSLVVIAINAFRAPTIRIAETKSKPNMELPEHCNFHTFIVSHSPKKDMPKTQKIVRTLQLMLPEIKVWFDADYQPSIGGHQVKEKVMESTMFTILYQPAYFLSLQCRREVQIAAETNTPVLVIYEGDGDDLGKIKDECRQGFFDHPEPNTIYDHIFATTPIQWLDTKYFTIESVKAIALCLLQHLPHYENNGDLLEKGLEVDGSEFGHISLEDSVNVLYCRANSGAAALAEEIMEMRPSEVFLHAAEDCTCMLKNYDNSDTSSLDGSNGRNDGKSRNSSNVDRSNTNLSNDPRQ